MLFVLAGGDRRARATQLQDEFREQQGNNPRCPADCDSAVSAGLKIFCGNVAKATKNKKNNKEGTRRPWLLWPSHRSTQNPSV